MAWHPGKSCDVQAMTNANEEEFFQYAKNNSDFVNCPKCKARAER